MPIALVTTLIVAEPAPGDNEGGVTEHVPPGAVVEQEKFTCAANPSRAVTEIAFANVAVCPAVTV